MPDSTPWFEVWFDSPYYPVLYQNRNHDEARLFIDHLTEWLEIPKDSKVLDLACGRGRHANYLAEKGYQVVGLDISPKSIETAIKRYQNSHLDFFIHDMRQAFRLNYFDYILNFFTSFGYFKQLKENQEVFSAIHKGLKPGGRAMIDFMNVEKVLNNIVDRETKEINGINFYIRRNVEDGFIKKTIKVDDGKKISFFKEEVQILKPVHFYQMIQDEGFKLIKEFGDYQLGPFDSKSSDRYILIIEKL
ncbi:MAG TPA: methyltransferase domain-containing protein [Chitinophagales bacterium]|nr:methyltransferase domain-containing protein [Chitinophagales bacterium]